MRRAAIVLAIGMAALLLVGGTALAATLACNGGRCVGSPEPDSMFGSNMRDQIFSRAGGDLVRGNLGNDFIDGGTGSDRLLGGRGDDAVQGNDGDDYLAGNQGNDNLNGGAGNDRIEAVDGARDTIVCGPGPSDVVVFDARIDRFSGCEILRSE